MTPGRRVRRLASKLYGGSINQFNHSFKNFGWNVVWADPDDLAELRDARSTPKTKAIFIEIDRQSRRHHHRHRGDRRRSPARAGVPLIVDNTLATPYLCRPIEHGADIVVHSLTKFLGGHGNSIGGMIVDGGTFDWSRDGPLSDAVASRGPEYHGIVLHETFGNFAFAIACRVLGLRDLGPALSPFNAFLILTGIETLPLRMQRHCDNALAVAEWLSKHPQGRLGELSRPAGRPLSQPRARNTARRAPARCSPSASRAATRPASSSSSNVKLFSHLANIGDTRSLIIHPASTTHRQLSDAQKVAAGAGPDVVRLSIGIEDSDDIIADLEQALTA